MSYNKILLYLLGLTFLSGSFTLGRLQVEGFNVEVKYILLLLFIITLFFPNNKESSFKSIKFSKPFLSFLLISLSYLYISLLSIYNSNNISISIDKFVDILFMIVLIGGLTYTVSRIKKEYFFWIISGLMIFIGFVYSIPIYLSTLEGSARGEFSLGGPNVTTRILFFASCCSVYRFSINRNKIYFALFIFFLGGIVLLGSRGGFVGAALTLLTLWFVKYVFRKWKIKRKNSISIKGFAILATASFILSLIYQPLKRVFQSRIIGDTFTSGGIYTAGRDMLYMESLRMIKEKPFFGHGLNGFASVSNFNYPHNLLLEMMIDIGIIGALYFFILLLYAFIVMFKLKNTSLFVLAGLPLYMIIVQMFSGGIYDFRYYFFWAVPLIYYGVSKQEGIIENGYTENID
ncbi:O-antigen ligase family protein [Alteribacillus bidgolensis]|uniref:O-antigen ligase n=1 Tax=Alteribacillus bidgolensis TaxID=930129 RepID=A0A1G8PNQ3_9BACI|nr:O-antigen ligase family protein [Alteribacillus bidgolensis]SDI94124.1 O-antigen ligase [Alteribacillus bidgolensis]